MGRREERFSTGFGSAMALIGVSVGLANVWRFPYMAGEYGGGAFVALYLLLVGLLGAPALIAEWSLGRLSRGGPGTAFRRIGMPFGGAIGAILFLTVFMATSYYTVVVAQVLYYAVRGAAIGEPEAFYAANFQGITGLNAGLTALVFAAMGVVVAGGVRRGIERVSRIAMPIAGVALVAVVFRSLTLPGAAEGVRWFLWPALDEVTGTTFLAALGQAFFSLSLGGTFFLAYGSYLPSAISLRRLAGTTIAGDTGAALLGGLAVLPAAIALGIAPASGPPLLFFTLPRVFAAMPAGEIFGPLFFGGLFVAAFLSAVAGLEVSVGALCAWTRWRRTPVVLAALAVLLPLALPSMASTDYLAWSDLLWGSTMQPLGLRVHPDRARFLRIARPGARRSEPGVEPKGGAPVDLLDPLGDPGSHRRRPDMGLEQRRMTENETENETTTRVEAPKRVRHGSLHAFTRRSLVRARLAPELASRVAAALVGANLSGWDEDGVALLPELESGLSTRWLNPRPSVRTVSASGAVLVIDGDNGPGPAVAHRAMTEATAAAARNGIGAAGARGSNHFGAPGYFARMALERQMVGIAMSGGPEDRAAPGRWPAALGIAIPTGENEAPLILNQRFHAGSEGPENADSLGLALTVEALAALAGGALPPELAKSDRPDPVHRGTSHLFLAFRVRAFAAWAEFRNQMVERVTALRRARTLYPGQDAFGIEEERRTLGIPIDRETEGELGRLASRLDLHEVWQETIAPAKRTRPDDPSGS